MEDDNSPLNLELTVHSLNWCKIKEEDAWAKFFTNIAHKIHSKENLEGEISLVLSDDDEVQSLNKHYRSKDKPTNVLSFPQEITDHLGDVILSFETIKKEAQEQKKEFLDHVTHLFVHGILHLLGYDHIQKKDQEEMEKLEIEILNKLGVKNPYD